MQIRMKLRGNLRSNVRTSVRSNEGANAANGSSRHVCSDCNVMLLRQQMEFVCPNCGMVEEFIEGSE